ncbi:cytochrome c-type biogenesis protein [Thalassotalea agarivorans]|uniref:Cytochrome c-type biogenesis protein n=1 Tax=Thalassotalea agarivorans TaxID=349064 RepID=A0A1H9Y1A1_THASX|nr:cytochrome c-type biogenesis protein [Thalassotalea agarivorans]SES62475.1 cytochrome c-type biogenesis protein CcmH [Thalassotalea agarivorans]
MKPIITLVLFIIVSATFAVNASSDTYVFQDEVTKKRYQSLVKELRCPKCQNQNLADSNSEIAIDLRQQVYDMLQQGRSDQEIVQFMVERYGEFVLYRPKISPLTYVLWFGPIVLVIVGFIALILILRKKPEKKAKTLTAEQQQKLEDLLKEK